MKTLPNLDWLRKGTPLPGNTATAQLAADPGLVRAGRRIADARDVRDWLGGTTEVSEESVGLGAYGKVLTVLSSSASGQEDEPDDEEESEEDVIGRWKPRFRR